MSKFKFALCQRVIVPGTDGIQGSIQARTERNGAQPRYLIVHLDDEGKPVGGDHDESAIVVAQPFAVKLTAGDGSTYDTKVGPRRNAVKSAARKRR